MFSHLFILLYIFSSTTKTPTFTFINMARRDNPHRKGASIRVTHGTHKGKTGTIQKVNLVRHSVIFENGDTGFVQRTYCDFIESASLNGNTGQPDKRSNSTSRTSRLSSTISKPSSIPHTSVDSVPDLSSMLSNDNSYAESRHGSEVTSQVLLDLLANSIASMHLEDSQVDEWALQLHDRITYFRHGPA
jgi:hypothetical protein